MTLIIAHHKIYPSHSRHPELNDSMRVKLRQHSQSINSYGKFPQLHTPSTYYKVANLRPQNRPVYNTDQLLPDLYSPVYDGTGSQKKTTKQTRTQQQKEVEFSSFNVEFMSRVDYGSSRDLKQCACGRSAHHILKSLVTSIVLSICIKGY